MDIKQLFYFSTVVQEKTISGASRKLHISQPPLSTALKQLETELNTTLFLRGNREIQLTDSGRFLYQKAQEILTLYDETLAQIATISSGKSGFIKVGVVSSTENVFLDKISQEFHQEFPDIGFEIHEGNTYQLLELLNSHVIDVAFVRTPFEENNLERILIQSEPIIALGTEHLFDYCANDSISLSSLANSPLIVYRRWLKIIKSEFASRNIDPQFICINDDARTSAAWIDKGMGIGIVPASTAHLLRNTQIQKKLISDFTLNTDIVCMFAPEEYRSDVTRTLYDFIQDSVLGI